MAEGRRRKSQVIGRRIIHPIQGVGLLCYIALPVVHRRGVAPSGDLRPVRGKCIRRELWNYAEIVQIAKWGTWRRMRCRACTRTPSQIGRTETRECGEGDGGEGRTTAIYYGPQGVEMGMGWGCAVGRVGVVFLGTGTKFQSGGF